MHTCAVRQAGEAQPADNAPSRGAAASDKDQHPFAPQQTVAHKGVAPGSFMDLLLRSTDKTTSKGLTDYEIANQVAHPSDFRSHPQGSVWRMPHAPVQDMV